MMANLNAPGNGGIHAGRACHSIHWHLYQFTCLRRKAGLHISQIRQRQAVLSRLSRLVYLPP